MNKVSEWIRLVSQRPYVEVCVSAPILAKAIQSLRKIVSSAMLRRIGDLVYSGVRNGIISRCPINSVGLGIDYKELWRLDGYRMDGPKDTVPR